VVTLTCMVPSNDPSSIGHGILMDTYVEGGLNCPRGKSVSFTFTATTPGTFAFVCTQPTCGVGHTSMLGRMIVNAAPQGPTISSISPNNGPTTGGTTVTISGANFQSGATVTFGGVNAQVTNVTSSSITVVTPLGPTSEQLSVDVVVTNPDGSSVTAAGGFTYTVPPLQVTAISPNVGTTGGGETITITGQGFTNALSSSVTVGGVAATNVTIDSPVSMHATLPPHAVGVADVVVTVGNSSVTKSGAITYELPPPRRHAARH
ncbi:MAG TPA: IPT/TIG domain-containing protein, partial [Thermoanaerobaculia bacterium]|nr:IPT/TIG domain-containing protein [Thermoanaerobaculia bacterium]